jgi:hypothetical protein
MPMIYISSVGVSQPFAMLTQHWKEKQPKKVTKRRIQTANRCFFGLRKHLQWSHVSRQTKCTIHKTLIHTVLFYGSETWVLTKREENQLLVFERKVLRMICDPKIENGVYRRRYLLL